MTKPKAKQALDIHIRNLRAAGWRGSQWRMASDAQGGGTVGFLPPRRKRAVSHDARGGAVIDALILGEPIPARQQIA